MKWHVVNSLFMQVPRRAQSEAANAFDELRAAQRQLAGLAQPSYDSKGEMVLHYPEYKILSVHNNKDQLHLDLFETFQRNGLGWMSSEHASNLGTPFLNALAKLLWEITDHWATLANKHCQPDPWWDPFASRRKLTHKGARQFDKAAVEQLLSAVEDEMMKSWWDSASEWSKVCMPLLCACCVRMLCACCVRTWVLCMWTDCLFAGMEDGKHASASLMQAAQQVPRSSRSITDDQIQTQEQPSSTSGPRPWL